MAARNGGFGPYGGFDNFLQVFSQEHLWWGVAALAISHLWSFVVNYLGRGEYRRTAVPMLMFQPYARIVVLHIAILIGGIIAFMLGSNILVLTILIAGKTLLDLSLHLAQRTRTTLCHRISPPILPEVILGEAGQTHATPPAAAPSHRPPRSSSGD